MRPFQTHLPSQQVQWLTVIEAEAQGGIGQHTNQAGCHTLHTRSTDTSDHYHVLFLARWAQHRRPPVTQASSAEYSTIPAKDGV